MLNNDLFFKYVEGRGNSGYKSAILVQEPGQDKYSMLLASTTVPSVFGTQDSFEFDLLNSSSKGKIAGKESLDEKDVEFLLHRDNIFRLERFRDTTLNLMYFTPDFMGWKFTGKITSRPNDAGADVLMGTYTITPMSAQDKPTLDVRGEVMETLCFANAIPESIKSGEKVDFSVVQAGVTPTYEIKKIDAENNLVAGGTLTPDSGKNTMQSITATESGLYAITVSATSYAPWTTTIYVEKTAS